MTAIPSSVERRLGRTPRLVVLAIAAGWALAVAADLTGAAGALHHDALIGGGLPLGAALALFLLAWQAMVAAMMLPSSLPLIRLFDAVTRERDGSARERLALIGGYVAVWTAFGAVAFLGDVAVHRTVEAHAWIDEHPGFIAGGVLALAGAFQFSGIKDRCLSKCRHPAPYLLGHYRRGAAAGFRLGLGHGLFCLGCCWALMLVVFSAGVAVLWWMAALTAVMVYEKTGRHGPAVGRLVGFALLVLAAFAVTHPA